MFQNKLVILFLIVFSIGFSQEKQNNIIYIYEDVVIKDTVFVYKKSTVKDTVDSKSTTEIPNLKKSDFKSEISILKPKQDSKNKLFWWRLRLRLLTDQILKQESVLNSSRIRDDLFSYEPIEKSWLIGAKIHTGKQYNTFFNEFNIHDKTIIGTGFWTRKQVFQSKFSVSLGIDALFYAKQSVTSVIRSVANFNEDYFTEEENPLIFKYMKSNSYQIQVPIQICYNFNRFVLSAGGYTSYCTYTLGMYGSTSDTLNYSDVQNFKAEVIQIGYTAELQYMLLKHFAVGVMASYGGFENLIFQNNQNQIFKSIHSFKEAKGMLQLVYIL